MVQGIGKASVFLVIAVMACISSKASSVERPEDSISPYVTQLETSRDYNSYIRQHITELATPDYIKQIIERNACQRRGHVDMLFGAVADDGLITFLSYIKTEIVVRYALLHKIFVVFKITLISGETITYTLPDIREYSSDPWKKEWWSYR